MKILVPVDGSQPSLRAVRLAIAMAKKARPSEIALVNVQDTRRLDFGELGPATPTLLEQAAREEGEQALRRAVALCKAAKVKYSAQVEIGAIAETAFQSGGASAWTISSWARVGWAACAACCWARWRRNSFISPPCRSLWSSDAGAVGSSDAGAAG